MDDRIEIGPARTGHANTNRCSCIAIAHAGRFENLLLLLLLDLDLDLILVDVLTMSGTEPPNQLVLLWYTLALAPLINQQQRQACRVLDPM